MPKEYIEDCHGGIQSESSDSPVTSPNRVKVGWNRETGYVQLATVNPAGEEVGTTCRNDTDGDGDCPACAGGQKDPLCRETAYVEGGWYVDLDAAGIGALIKVLRRARQQAFGVSGEERTWVVTTKERGPVEVVAERAFVDPDTKVLYLSADGDHSGFAPGEWVYYAAKAEEAPAT